MCWEWPQGQSGRTEWGRGEDQARTGGRAVRACGPLCDTCFSPSGTIGKSGQRGSVLGREGQQGAEGEQGLPTAGGWVLGRPKVGPAGFAPGRAYVPDARGWSMPP